MSKLTSYPDFEDAFRYEAPKEDKDFKFKHLVSRQASIILLDLICRLQKYQRVDDSETSMLSLDDELMDAMEEKGGTDVPPVPTPAPTPTPSPSVNNNNNNKPAAKKEVVIDSDLVREAKEEAKRQQNDMFSMFSNPHQRALEQEDEIDSTPPPSSKPAKSAPPIASLDWGWMDGGKEAFSYYTREEQ